jgi:hypothetical protein
MRRFHSSDWRRWWARSWRTVARIRVFMTREDAAAQPDIPHGVGSTTESPTGGRTL